MRVSSKRMLLAVYVDFLFLASALALLNHWLEFTQHNIQRAETVIAITIAVCFSFIIKRLSIGRIFLSITKDDCVLQEIKMSETFWTIFVATLLVLDGTKQLVRWTQLNAWPFFGFIPQGEIYAVLSLITGGLFILAGYWVYKLNVRGLYLSLILITGQLISLIMSKDFLAGIIAEKVVVRRQIQGIPVRDNEIEFMQSLMIPGFITLAATVLLILLFHRKHFKAIKYRLPSA